MPTVSVLPASTRPSGAGRRSRRGPSAGLEILKALLGLGAMATALLGPLALGWIDYHVSSRAADQLRGGDVAGLVLVGPVALAAAWRVATSRSRLEWRTKSAPDSPKASARRRSLPFLRSPPACHVPRRPHRISANITEVHAAGLVAGHVATGTCHHESVRSCRAAAIRNCRAAAIRNCRGAAIRFCRRGPQT